MKSLKRNIPSIFLLILLTAATMPVRAQRTTINAAIDPAEILIGEQAVLTLKINTPKDRQLVVPEIMVMPGIELIEELKPDTAVNQQVMTIVKRYVITSFDSTLYVFPPVCVIDGSDTIFSPQSPGLKVTSVQLPDTVLSYIDRYTKGETDSIDFEAAQLNEIKNNESSVLSFWEKILLLYYQNPLLFWLIVAGVILLAGAAVCLFLYLRKRKRGYYFTPEKELPPHLVALQQLERIQQQHLPEQGKVKEHYTELADVLRKYIEKRYGIKAFEQTSGQTLESVSGLVEEQLVVDKLKELLGTSDMVKFAKFVPDKDMNDLCLSDAYNFVVHTQQTAPEEDSGGDNSTYSHNYE